MLSRLRIKCAREVLLDCVWSHSHYERTTTRRTNLLWTAIQVHIRIALVKETLSHGMQILIACTSIYQHVRLLRAIGIVQENYIVIGVNGGRGGG